jgi:hypothetical protein
MSGHDDASKRRVAPENYVASSLPVDHESAPHKSLYKLLPGNIRGKFH